MSKYKIFHGLVLSLYSKDFYNDVVKNWKGKAFLTLALLLIICWIPQLFQMHNIISKWINNDGQKIIEQIPEITIRNGNLDIDKEMPYFVTDSNGVKTVCVFDTTGKYKTLNDVDSPILVTKNTMTMKKSKYETRNYDLYQIQEFSMTKNDLKKWVEFFRKFSTILILPFILLSSFIYRFFLSVFYGFIGFIITKIAKKDIEFTPIVQVAVLSMTLPIILKTIFTLTKTHIPYFWLISFGISMGYLIFGIMSKEELPKEKLN